ncbi:MAG: hypothetical protein QM723_30220 [Myxococcaceae bacterium]
MYAETLRTDGLDSGQFHTFYELAKAEAKDAPGPELAELLDGLLTDPRLVGRVIAGHLVVRPKLLELQQALGFPWALQIDPEDLALLHPPDPQTGLRAAAMLMSLVSTLFNGGFAAMTWREPPIALFFAVGLGHALTVLVSAATHRTRKRLRVLGWMWLLGPLFTLGTMVVAGRHEWQSVAGLGLTFALPAMATAWLALGLSRKAPE